MIERRTVLILGAGASKPYGLPLGQELRDDVIRASEEIGLLSNLSKFTISEESYFDFTNDLAKSGFPSVDAFLENRVKWTAIGKAAMALCLLRAEATAAKRLFPPNQPRDHWYETLWSKLKAPSWQAFKSNPWHVVTFNYDRSLEHYFVKILSNNYSIKENTVCRALPVLHVHGSLGEYDDFAFGGSIYADIHDIASRSIRVVHESDVSKSEFTKVHQLIRNAESVLFIGFGYHEQNMKKLGLAKIRHSMFDDQDVAGTHKGIRAMEWKRFCEKHFFSYMAHRHGGGTISEFVTDWLQ